ncbi:ubiquinone biosynthesis protein COQ4 homolog, mitochondrial-like isoform X1 [Nicotiana sylvestris]|uniref:Ubiquinone biosynthesis protein COQ4 homolog, mitochondrial-like isoform X2 n=1 Tax=Nicotiana sylvestris TaxID=4096 RepID=A0A1U7W7K7_NICSY|nr:PREDICTED: ubiquinone biosynthesis protein COQ4 homolog, mitochondrial-like isoform X2 [Nicotiana sylvestris]
MDKYQQSKEFPIGVKNETKKPNKSASELGGALPLRFSNWGAMIAGIRIRLKGWQQAAVAVGSAVGALLDPRRADLIAALGETTGKPAFDRVLERMKKSPEGRGDFGEGRFGACCHTRLS